MTPEPLDSSDDLRDIYTVCPACQTTFLFAGAEACECGEWLHPECVAGCPHFDGEAM